MPKDDNNEQNEQKKSAILEQVKKASKGGVKKIALHLLKFLLPVVPIILLALFFYGIVGAVADFFSGIAENIEDFFKLDDTGSIIITDEDIDKIIEKMKNELNISPEDLNLLGDIDYNDPNQEEAIKRAERKYIKLFLEAQETTSAINDGGFFGTGLGAEGSVYIKTVNNGANTTADLKDMEATTMESLESKAKNGASDIWGCFSINESGQLVVPAMNNGVIGLTSIDYKNMISQYSTPWNFFIDLEMVVQNPKFMEAFVDLVKDSKINLTVLYNITYTKETITHEYMVSEIRTTQDGKMEVVQVPKVETIVNEYENRNPTLVITTADTWIYSREATYTASTTTTKSDPIVTGTEDDKYTTVVETTTTTYSQDGVAKEAYNGGKKGEDGTFVGLLDKKFKIPNSPRTAMAGESLVSGAEILFDLLRRSENTQPWENIMRYVLYVYTGHSYGITEFDFSLFAINTFNTMSGATNLATYLRQFSHSGEAPQSADGKYYLMFGDGMGWPTIGNADIQWKAHHSKFNKSGKVLQNGTEVTVPSVEQYVNGILGSSGAKYSNSAIRQMQIYIDKEFVDEIGESIVSGSYDLAAKVTSGLNLSQQQLYALSALAHNRPAYISGDNINGYRNFKQVYLAATAKYEINSWQHNKFIWDNWWCYLGGGAAGHIPARDAAFETYVKGIYDFSQSPAGEIFSRKYYIYYTQAQLNRFSYAPRKPITRTTANEQEIFTYEEKSPAGAGGITTEEERAALQATIENEWLHTKYHINNSAYQQGPFIKYWANPYNTLQPFQCTWWAYGRASMYLEQYGTKYTKYPKQASGRVGNGGEWYDVNLRNGWFQYGSEPRANSVVSWKKSGGYGHVAYVEGVTNDGIYISEAGSGRSWMGIRKIPLSGQYGSYRLNGYIYLDSPN